MEPACADPDGALDPGWKLRLLALGTAGIGTPSSVEEQAAGSS
jgi:hypothetical protein